MSDDGNDGEEVKDSAVVYAAMFLIVLLAVVAAWIVFR